MVINLGLVRRDPVPADGGLLTFRVTCMHKVAWTTCVQYANFAKESRVRVRLRAGREGPEKQLETNRCII